ncbi:MAG: NAD(P)/FAD-dependent oxidoreductase [Clostridia bacterium]|nr:NAD(P)/FAD-dependent oxidoreductase [Clostridia bacterium]
MKNVCVIGGGASGLMAAYAAAENGNRVVLLEKNEKLGKKIYITGKGRCNITNDIPPDEFLQNVVHGAKFLTGAIYSFPPKKVVEFFESHGLPVKTERGGRVFPVSDHASDVTKTLERACKSVGVEIRLGETVKKISLRTSSDISAMPRIAGVETDKQTYPCDEAVVCTGGLSYPSTGSTGDGYRFAKDCGLFVTDLKPGLCGINLQGTFYKDLQGLSLKNVSLTAKRENKILYQSFGEMLFTHFGISGPLVLSLSSVINRSELKGVTLFLDLKPALDFDTLDRRLLRDFEKYKNKQLLNAMCELLPQKMIAAVLAAAGISEKKNVNVLTKEERFRLLNALKEFPVKPVGLRGFEEAIITSGGVELSEINPKTMESKKVSGLRFCGEVLDADAFTGGYNLQIAFSTGYAAGRSIR